MRKCKHCNIHLDSYRELSNRVCDNCQYYIERNEELERVSNITEQIKNCDTLEELKELLILWIEDGTLEVNNG